MKKFLTIGCLSLMATALFSQNSALDFMPSQKHNSYNVEETQNLAKHKSLTQIQTEGIIQQLDSLSFYLDGEMDGNVYFTYYPDYSLQKFENIKWNPILNEFFVTYSKEYDEHGNLMIEFLKMIDSEQNEEYLLDDKIVYAYNGNNDPITLTYYRHIDGEWLYSQKSEYVYNENNLLIESLKSRWAGNNWENLDKNIYLYNDADLQTVFIHQDWVGSSWVNDKKTSSVYNDYDLKISEIDEEWDGAAWFNKEKTLSIYDAGNNIIEQEKYDFIELNWVEANKSTYDYDSQNLLLVNNTYVWNVTEWENSSKYEYTYINESYLKTEIISSWDGTVWIENRKNENLYDIHFNLISDKKSIFSDSEWINEKKIEREFDINNNKTNESNYIWNITNSEWDMEDSYQLEFNTDYLKSQLALPFIVNNMFSETYNKLTNTSFEIFSSDSEFDFETIENILYYSDTPTSVQEITEGAFSVYPNPASDYIMIETNDLKEAKIELMDVNGRLLKSQKLDNNTRIDTKMLSNGIYLYKIKHTEGVQSGKIMINN